MLESLKCFLEETFEGINIPNGVLAENHGEIRVGVTEGMPEKIPKGISGNKF